MKNMLILWLITFIVPFGYSQTGQKAKETSDPAAKAILEKLRKKYEGFKAVEVDFNLTIEIAERDKEVQKGVLVQQGDKYKLTMNNHAIYSDGKILWMFLKKNNEVQINNVDDFEDSEDELMNPKDLLRIYEKKNYIYHLVNEGTKNGILVQEIEFKPIDRNSEYSKMRLTLDKKKNEVVQIIAFNKDGSRYTMDVVKLKPNLSYKNADFVFDPAKYPGIHIEDLRID